MAKKNRKQMITGNWKMYKTIPEAVQFVETLASKFTRSQVGVQLAVPYTLIAPLKKRVDELGASLVIGAQNMNDASEGAFTGEIAAAMLKEVGATFVLLGHSERRHIFHEEDAFINRKVLRALSQGISPILCIGERLEEREQGQTFTVIERQLSEGLKGVKNASLLSVAYEPVWAIGTGKVATKEEAQEVHAFCRKKIGQLLGQEVSESITIYYGGSVKPENSQSLLSQEDIDGLLVGGASLDVEAFYKIVQACEAK